MIQATASAVWQAFFQAGVNYGGGGRDTKAVSFGVDIVGDSVSLVVSLVDDPNTATLISFTLDGAGAAALAAALTGS